MAKGGADKGFGGGKGGDIKGCVVVGHKSSECLHQRSANAVEDDVGRAVSHVEVGVGRVWMIGAVEDLAWVGAAAEDRDFQPLGGLGTGGG